MAVYKAKEEKWTKDGRKWFFVASYKTSDGKRKKFHSRKYFTRMDAYDEERTFLLSRNPQKIDKYITFKELYGLFYFPPFRFLWVGDPNGGWRRSTAGAASFGTACPKVRIYKSARTA